jgi:hypothetical protein
VTSEQKEPDFDTQVEDIRRARAKREKRRKAKGFVDELPEAVRIEEFLYCSPENKYIFVPNGSLWPAPAVDKRLPWIGGTKPSTIIARTNPVEDMTWLPGEPLLIKHKLIVQGGVIEAPNKTMYNFYRGANFVRTNTDKANVWTDHIRYVYPNEADHIIKWFAYRCQHPDIKIEHALVLGGTFGIGKDTLLEPVLHALGPWNVASVAPTQMLERFNGHLKSILLVINEARDLGDVNRPQFYERLKMIISSPLPLLIDEKNRHPYYIKNLVGVIYTTNHKVGGIYLAPDDRRHLVAWSVREMDDFKPDYKQYFDAIWAVYNDGGRDAIASYLHSFDVSDFNPKAPPPKTEAFHEIVMASQSPDASELTDLLFKFGNPSITGLTDLCDMSVVDEKAVEWLRDKHNRRMWPRWFEASGYIIVRNPDAKDGMWLVSGKKCMLYGRKDLPFKELQFLARLKARGAVQ